jgi:hypothetical protein
LSEEGKGRRIWSMYFLYKYEYGTLKTVEAILRGERRKRENNGRNEPNQGTLYAYMEMSQ